MACVQATAFNSTKGVAGTLAQLAGLTKAQGRDEERQHQTAQDDTPDPNPMQGLNLAHLATLQVRHHANGGHTCRL